MRCPNCGRKIGKDNKCDNCKLHFVYEKNNNTVIFIVIIILSIMFLCLILFFNYKKNDNNVETNTTTTTTSVNNGVVSSFINPFKIGSVLLSSYYDGENYYDVDVEGIKFLDYSEIDKQNDFEKLDEYNIYGFIYKVNLNYKIGDGINPVLNAEFRLDNGNDFLNYNGKNRKVEIKSYYDGNKIKENESANILVVYSIPDNINNYSICIGYENKHDACFTK